MNSSKRFFQAVIVGLVVAAFVFLCCLKSPIGTPCLGLFEAKWQAGYYEHFSPTRDRFDQYLDPQRWAYERNLATIQTAQPEIRQRFFLIEASSVLAGFLAALFFGLVSSSRANPTNKTYQTGARLVSSREVKKLVRKGVQK